MEKVFAVTEYFQNLVNTCLRTGQLLLYVRSYNEIELVLGDGQLKIKANSNSQRHPIRL